jgi:hypothetical protein
MRAALIVAIAAAALYLPSRIDMARRNRRARLARCGWLDAQIDAQIELALEAGVIRDLGDDVIYQDMCFQRWEQEMSGGAS